LTELIAAETPAVSIFGKSWLLHVENALRITPEENISMIGESVDYAKRNGKEVVYDAEHFFDGYKSDPSYALQSLKAAENGGADVIVLCDTNGGSFPWEIGEIISIVREKVSIPLGIHTHNDSELAVANTLAAVENGVEHVQGTINGYGERCGNANLCSVIPNLQIKMNYDCIPDDSANHLTALSHFVSEIANRSHQANFPFVGRSSFAHKGGIHVNAVMKDPVTYEHIKPESVGNKRRVLVSDLSGKSNILYKAEEMEIDLNKNKEKIPEIVNELKILEKSGFQFEAAEGSFELLIKKTTGEWNEFFELGGFRILIEKDKKGIPRSEATIRLKVDGLKEHIACEGKGPVHALDEALRKALTSFYPEVKKLSLSDYKVRVLNKNDGTKAQVRVLIDFSSEDLKYGTVGVSGNIIEASWQALTDGYSYYLLKSSEKSRKLNKVTAVI
ncbi:citramalate synthase, partial [candidate division KSB1 bacterium]